MCKFIVLKWLGFFGHTFHLSSSISSHFLCFWGPWPRRSEPIYPARLMPSLGAGCRSEMCIQSVCKRTLHLVSTSEIRSFGDEKWWRFSFHRTVTNVLARAWDERTNFRWIWNDFLLFTSIPVHSMGPDSNIWWPDLSISGVGCGPALARRCFQAGFAFQRWRLKSLTFGKCFQSRMFCDSKWHICSLDRYKMQGMFSMTDPTSLSFTSSTGGMVLQMQLPNCRGPWLCQQTMFPVHSLSQIFCCLSHSNLSEISEMACAMKINRIS